MRVGGGVDTGRTVIDSCFVVNSPQQLKFSLPASSTDTPGYCHAVTPFKGQTQLKLYGIFPLPGQFAASAAYQNLSGPSYGANYSATPAEIAPSLGRNPSGGANLIVPLVPPNTLFEERISRLDLRLSKLIQLNRFRVQLNLDAYNALNANSIRAINSTYGAFWRNATQILDPRLVELGFQLNF
jgi:hypothetical protein